MKNKLWYMLKKIFQLIGILFLISMLHACSPKKTHNIYLKCSASTKVNPDIYNQPSPIVIVVYHLKDSIAFQNTDFFSLYNNPKVVLGDDLIAVQQIELQPSQKINIMQNIKPDTKCLGIIAAYRNLEKSSWQQIMYLNKIKKTHIKIVANENAVQIEF